MSETQTSPGRAADAEGRSRRSVVMFVDRWESPSILEHIEAIADAFPHWSISVVQQNGRQRLGPRVRRYLKRFAKDPVAVASQLAIRIGRKLARPTVRSSLIPFPENLAELSRPNVAYRRFDRLHSPEAIEHVRSLEPWLGLSIAAPILKKSLFEIPTLGTINIHKSLLPDYRGFPYAFWELHEGASESGVSIHWVDEGLDTGPVIERRPHPIAPYATVRGLAAELDWTGTDLLIQTLRRLDVDPTSMPGERLTHGSKPPNRMPTWRQTEDLRRRLQERRTRDSRPNPVKTAAKQAAAYLYTNVYAGIRNVLLGCAGRCRTSILLYHRIHDGYLDGVTVGVEQFERQIAMLTTHYDVIDLSTFLASRGKPRRRPTVVITFDDGYRDNHLAATLLRRLGLPGTFFVSTEIVGTDRAFPHDLETIGHGVPTMTWDQIRQLRNWGFRIGNHTRNHVNLGEVPVERGVAEVVGAREDLERELGPIEGARWLAYPYGQRRHMNEELRRRLPELGVTHCFSAYGGTNPIDFDPYDVKRQSVDHRFSLERLRAAVEGWVA